MLRYLVRRLPGRSRQNALRPLHTALRHVTYSFLNGPHQAMVGLYAFIGTKTLGADPWMVALLSALPPLSNLFGLYWGPRMSNRPKIPFVFWPELINVAVLVLLGFTRTALAFTTLVCFSMFFRSPVVSASAGIWRVNYSPRWRAKLVGHAMAASIISSSVFAHYAGLMLDAAESPERQHQILLYLFLAVAGLALIAAFYFRTIRVRGEARTVSGAQAPADLLQFVNILRTDHRFRRYQYSFFLFGSGNMMLLPVLPLFLTDELHADYAQASYVFVVIPSLLHVIFLPFWGWALDRGNPLLVRLFTNGVWTLFPLCLFLAQDIHHVYAGKAIQGVLMGGSGLVWLLGVNYYARTEEVPAYAAIHQTLTGIRGLIAPLGGVWLMSHIGYRYTFLVSTVVMSLGTLVMLLEVLTEYRTFGLRSSSEVESTRE